MTFHSFTIFWKYADSGPFLGDGDAAGLSRYHVSVLRISGVRAKLKWRSPLGLLWADFWVFPYVHDYYFTK